MKNTMKYGIVVGLVVIILGGAMYYQYSRHKSQQKWSSYLDGLLEQYPDCPEGSLGLRDTTPDNYDYLPRKMFCQLPPMSEVFMRFKVLYDTGKIADINEWGPDIWAQPEMLPSYGGQMVPVLQNPDPSRYGISIPAVTPADAGADVYPDTQFTLYTTVRTGALGNFYLGLRPVAIYPAVFKSKSQDPASISKYFDVSFTPEQFTLAPSWPVYIYNESSGEKYVYLVGMTIHAKPETPSGTYYIGMNFAPPSTEYNQRELHKYLNLYTSSIMGGITRPWYVVEVVVKPNEAG